MIDDAELNHADDVTPVDPVKPRRRVPQRGTRKRVLGQGEGDVCVLIISDGSGQIPQGCLIPIPGVPKFESAPEARRWIASSSGDLLANRAVIIFRACDLINVVVQTKSVVEIHCKDKMVKAPKVQETVDG